MTSTFLLGVHSATIDAEGRIQLPAGLRDELNVRQPEFRLMATLDADGSLCLRERDDFEAWVAALRRRPPRDQRERCTLLTVSAHSAPARCDKQGRVRIPDPLLALIGVDRAQKGAREVVLVGGFGDIRVWSPTAWASFAQAARETLGTGLDALMADDPQGSD